jgi:hypothetical protein
VIDLGDVSNPDSPRRAKKSFKWLLGIFATATVVVLGTTFASNINLNNNGPIEFGQGIATTVSCQSNPLLITPTETFDNATNTFVLSSLDFDNIDTACLDKYVKVSLWPATGFSPLIDFVVASDGITPDAPGDQIIASTVEPNLDGSAHIALTKIYNSNFDGSGKNNIPAAMISKITAESSATLPATGGEMTYTLGQYAVGDIGPGGGSIFYYSLSGFTETGAPCGSSCHYLESAPITGNNAWIDATYAWSRTNTMSTGASGITIGTGFANTQKMILQDNTAGFAGTISRAFRGPNNKNDWFLPSRDELYQLYLAETQPNVNFQFCGYWTSSELNSTDSKVLILRTGCYSTAPYDYSVEKAHLSNTRPIRAF